MYESNIIIGDSYIYTLPLTNYSKSLLNILSASNIKFHKTYPTHKYGNTFDLLNSRKSSNYLIYSHYIGPCINDNHIIYLPFQP